MGNPDAAWWSPNRYADSPESVDRALIVACAVAWLAALGVGVAATVALAQLGRGATGGQDGDGSGTPWLLYVVIGVSAAVIVAAVPLLLRARQSAQLESEEPGASASLPARTRPARSTAAVGRTATPDSSADTRGLPAEVLDRILLRVGLGVLAATGAAMTAVALAAYLLAVGSDGAAWAAIGVAAVITVAMAAIPVLHLRELTAGTTDVRGPAGEAGEESSGDGD
ncbi:DUF2561 family protein [Mycolicibacterium palauense]|uniref:DUF2561 family protein n=1 Tax=Mycolicibacterium palauense TaxID=2034511 RepID=UPI000BFEE054|nr:DUF2561 family protein [Mycolicibacterium palauense]